MSKADDIRAVMSGLDAKYRQLEHQRRDLDGKLDGVRMALDESVQQLREAIGRNDMREAQKLSKSIHEMDAVRVGTEEAIAGTERDMAAVAAEDGRQQEALRTPSSISYECPECGTLLTPTAPRKLPKGRRGATYNCGGCDVIYGVSWGAAEDDVEADAA